MLFSDRLNRKKDTGLQLILYNWVIFSLLSQEGLVRKLQSSLWTRVYGKRAKRQFPKRAVVASYQGQPTIQKTGQKESN